MLSKIIFGSALGISLLAIQSCSGSSSFGGGGGGSSITGTNAVFTKATNAVESAYADASSLMSMTRDINAFATCANGTPSSSNPGDAIFGAEDAFCVLNSNSKSPDTVQGSYYLVSAIICAIEKQVTFQYLSSATNHNNLSISESDSCFGAGGFDADNDNATTGSFTISISEKALSSGPFNFEIGIDLTNATFTAAEVSFYLKDSGGILAARVHQTGGSPSTFDIVLNSNTGMMFFENKDYANSRHVRLSVAGTFSTATGNFSNVTSAKYIHTEMAHNAMGSRSTIMYFDGTNDVYDHHVSGTRDGDYSAIPQITYNTDFYTYTGRAITDHNPVTDALIDLTTFNMAF